MRTPRVLARILAAAALLAAGTSFAQRTQLLD